MSDAAVLSDPPVVDSSSVQPDEQIFFDGGIKKKILRHGTGAKPADRSSVTVHYVGRLLDGTKFDSSRDRNQPFVFKIGKGEVIKGWDKGVATMQVGELAVLTCAPDFAYGASGSPPTIPPNATLEFEVELLSFDNTQMVTEDKGVMKRIQTEGTGYNRPNDFATVTVSYTGRVKGNETPFVQVENSTLQLTSDPSLPWGFEEAIKNMHEGEHSVFDLKTDKYTFGATGHDQFNIPPHAALEYDITMHNFVKGKETWEMNDDEKIERMTQYKNIGNKFFLATKYDLAEKLYTKAVKIYEYENEDLSEEQKKQIHSLKTSVYSNLAISFFKQNNLKKVTEYCNKALELDEKHVKCLYHRAVVYTREGKFTEAKADLQKAAEADPKNAAVKSQLQQVLLQIKKDKEKEKKLFGGFFNKVALVSEAELAAASSSKPDDAMSDSSSDSDSDSDADANADANTDAVADNDKNKDENMQSEKADEPKAEPKQEA